MCRPQVPLIDGVTTLPLNGHLRSGRGSWHLGPQRNHTAQGNSAGRLDGHSENDVEQGGGKTSATGDCGSTAGDLKPSTVSTHLGSAEEAVPVLVPQVLQHIGQALHRRQQLPRVRLLWLAVACGLWVCWFRRQRRPHVVAQNAAAFVECLDGLWRAVQESVYTQYTKMSRRQT